MEVKNRDWKSWSYFGVSQIMNDFVVRLKRLSEAYGLKYKNIFTNFVSPAKSQSAEKDSHESQSDQQETTSQSFDPQVIIDLAVFDLHPPSSIQEVKAARNEEFKKYHSDIFHYNSKKAEAAKEIMQIYNCAYERLKKHYNVQ